MKKSKEEDTVLVGMGSPRRSRDTAGKAAPEVRAA